jgi:hypothetical protein
MNVPLPDKFSVELLAAYADGELDAAGCAMVKAWLADHPEACDALRTQRELSATNTVLWQAAEPREPSGEAWALVRQNIESESTPLHQVQTDDRLSRLKVARWLLAGLTLSGTAAVLLLTLFTAMRQPESEKQEPAELASTHPEVSPAPQSPDADPLASIAVLPIPTDDEVILDRVPALHDGWLPVGRHPVPGMLILATVEEIYLEETVPSPGSPVKGGPKMTAAPGDAPMIFAAKHR